MPLEEFLQQLCDPDASTREFAASVLANSTLNEPLAKELLEAGHSRAFLVAAADMHLAVRAEAFGALRNISCLGAAACSSLMHDGVLDVVMDLLTTVRNFNLWWWGKGVVDIRARILMGTAMAVADGVCHYRAGWVYRSRSG